MNREGLKEASFRGGCSHKLASCRTSTQSFSSVSSEDRRRRRRSCSCIQLGKLRQSMELPASFCDHFLTRTKQGKDAELHGEGARRCSPSGVLEGIRQLGSSRSSTSCSAESQTVRRSNSLRRGFFRLWKKHRPTRYLSTRRTPRRAAPDLSGLDFCLLKPSWRSFSISELNKATDNFSTENLIGKGGYSEIYKGRLESGQLVAVKKLAKGTAPERAQHFLTEMGVVVHLNHPNTAKMIGFSIEGGLYLMLVLSPHGSLDNVLHGSNRDKLDWEKRYKIAVGTAKGLEYLHQRCQHRIIHRDIKAANILLAADFEPQICDFGLAKWLPDKVTHHTLPDFEGTFGYLAPECMDGVADEKTDVFAFGILLLELITGRRAVTCAQQSLLAWTKPMLEEHKIKDLVDPSLGDSYDSLQLAYMATAAHLCIQDSSVMRPRMSQVLRMLTGKGSRAEDPNRSARMTYSEDMHDAEEYTAARYLSDINRHKQIAFDFQSQ